MPKNATDRKPATTDAQIDEIVLAYAKSVDLNATVLPIAEARGRLKYLAEQIEQLLAATADPLTNAAAIERVGDELHDLFVERAYEFRDAAADLAFAGGALNERASRAA